MVDVDVLYGKRQTADRMYRIVDRYYTDLFRSGTMIDGVFVPLVCFPLVALFSLVSNIPYSQDVKPVEVVSRPAVSLAVGPTAGLDCKKKSIIMASWCRAHGVPFRFMSVSTRPGGEIHHVFCQAYVSGAWRNIDPTYNYDRLFDNKQVTAYEPL